MLTYRSSVATPFALLTYWVDSSVLSLAIFIIPTIAVRFDTVMMIFPIRNDGFMLTKC